MNNIIISIIVPFYNRFDLLKNCINSIVENKSNKYEVIIVDDGSNFNYSQEAKNLISHNVSYYKLKKNYERGFARNFGASKSNGLYLNFFDSDDLCLPNHIEYSLEFINSQNPEVFCNSYNIKNKSNNYIKIIHNSLINNKIYDGNSVSCNSVFIKKNIFLNYQFCTNKNLSGSEDWDLWLRLANDFKFYGNKIITSTIIDHENRSTRVQQINKVIKRLNFLLERVNNKELFKFNKINKRKVFSEISSFKALTYSFDKSFKIFTIKELIKSFLKHNRKIFLKRNLVVLKNLFN
tara:strand:+ start:972 stop:1850 length:879 start_codon:yes stop_codon:yes gene_type:complete